MANHNPQTFNPPLMVEEIGDWIKLTFTDVSLSAANKDHKYVIFIKKPVDYSNSHFSVKLANKIFEGEILPIENKFDPGMIKTSAKYPKDMSDDYETFINGKFKKKYGWGKK